MQHELDLQILHFLHLRYSLDCFDYQNTCSAKNDCLKGPFVEEMHSSSLSTIQLRLQHNSLIGKNPYWTKTTPDEFDCRCNFYITCFVFSLSIIDMYFICWLRFLTTENVFSLHQIMIQSRKPVFISLSKKNFMSPTWQ